MATTRKNVTFAMDEGLLKRVDEAAKEWRLTRSAFLERLVEENINKVKSADHFRITD